MKQLLMYLLTGWMPVAFAQQWQPMADFPGGARDDGTVFAIGDKAYCGLGMNAWFGCNGDFYAFSLDTESWSGVASMPAGKERQYACGFAHQGRGYVFGGIDGSGNYLADLWQYDPSADAWTAQAPLPAGGRAGAMCFVVGDTAYIAGGKTAAVNALNEVWAFNLASHTWTQKAGMPSASWRGVAFSWNGKGIAGLGKDAAGDHSGVFYSYDASSDMWEQIPGLAADATTYTAATQIGSLAFLYGGMEFSGAYLNPFTRIDLETYQSHALAPFPGDARRGGMAFAGDNEVYLTTGVSASGRLAETWKAGYVLSTEEVLPSQEVKVFPNPSEGAFQVSSPGPIGQVRITDLSGKEVFRQDFPAEHAEIDAPFSRGVYFLRIEGKEAPVRVVFR